jgi:hypothetical protein
VASPRAIRIPRASGATSRTASEDPHPLSTPTTETAPVGKPDIRYNQAALERARRLLLIYLGTLLVLYVGFVLLDRSSPGGTSSVAETGMIYFSAIAGALAVGGVWVAAGPVPRTVEVRSDSVVIRESWGTRRKFPPVGEIRVSVVHRYPRSFLSSRAVEAVEVLDEAGHRRTYHLEEGLLPERRPDPR